MPITRIRAALLVVLSTMLLCLPAAVAAPAQAATAATAATSYTLWDDPSVRDFYFSWNGENLAKVTVGVQVYGPCSHITYCSPTHIRTVVLSRRLNSATGIKVVLQRGGWVNPSGVWYESTAEVLDGGGCCANAYGPWRAKTYRGVIGSTGLCPSGSSVTWTRGSIEVRKGILLGYSGLSDPGRLCFNY